MTHRCGSGMNMPILSLTLSVTIHGTLFGLNATHLSQKEISSSGNWSWPLRKTFVSEVKIFTASDINEATA